MQQPTAFFYFRKRRMLTLPLLTLLIFVTATSSIVGATLSNAGAYTNTAVACHCRDTPTITAAAPITAATAVVVAAA
eukprot:SAG31_NODE_3596_length_4087_cov_28.925025_5_plen_77_part_00